MNIIVDTHFILWILTDAKKLTQYENDIICNPQNSIICSSISLFEISLKYSVGKLKLNHFEPEQIPGLLIENGYRIVDISYETVSSYYKLPNTVHRDPFDRLLIWEAIQRNFTLLTRDKEIKKYEEYGLKVI